MKTDNGPWLRKPIHLVDEIVEKTINDSNFNPDAWSEWDAERLIKAGEMILREIRESQDGPQIHIYGRDNTIHRTKLLNIEIDKKNNEVVSVWFRCMALPFDVTLVDKNRANEMRSMYQKNKMADINAIEVVRGKND